MWIEFQDLTLYVAHTTIKLDIKSMNPFIEDNVKQWFVEHFQKLNQKHVRVENYRHVEP